MIDVLLTPYGEYRLTNDQIRASTLHRAIKQHRDDMVKLVAYRDKLLYRYATLFCLTRDS